MKKKCPKHVLSFFVSTSALFPTQNPRSGGNRNPAPCYRSDSLPGPCAPPTGQGLARPPESLWLCSWGHRRWCRLARAALGQRPGGNTCKSRAPDDFWPEHTCSAVEAGGPGDPARSGWTGAWSPGSSGIEPWSRHQRPWGLSHAVHSQLVCLL